LHSAANPAIPPACEALVAVANLLAADAEVSVGTASANETVATTVTLASFENSLFLLSFFRIYFEGDIKL